MFRPRLPFDPCHILLQILAFQFAFYLVYLLIVLAWDFVASISFTVDQLLNYSVFRFSTTLGRASAVGQFCGGIGVAVFFSILESRWKRALDCISTTFIIHLLIVSVVCYFPKSFCWWICYLVSCGGSVLFAEKMSLRFEMQDINLDIALPAFRE
jgi:hypothetical protein